MQKLKKRLSWAICPIFSSLQAILKEISAIKICEIAEWQKKLMRHTFSVKFRVFRREFLRNHSVYWAQIFRDNWNCYALSIFRVFILLASSDSDKHMLMRQNSVNKDSPVRAVNPRDRARQSLLQQACKNKTWTMNCRIMRVSMMQINAILGGFSWLRNSKTPDIACTFF